MAEETFYADTNDYTDGTDGTQDDLIAEQNNFGNVHTAGNVYLDVLDTLDGGTITGAEMFVYSLDFVKTGTKPATSDHGALYIYTDPGTELIDEWTSYPGDNTWWSAVLSAGNRAYIGNGTDDPNYDTLILTAVDNPGDDRTRKWSIEAWNKSDGAGNEAYLVITYTPAAGGATKVAVFRMY